MREYNRNIDVGLEVWGSKDEECIDMTSWSLNKGISSTGDDIVGFLRQEIVMPTWKPQEQNELMEQDPSQKEQGQSYAEVRTWQVLTKPTSQV